MGDIDRFRPFKLGPMFGDVPQYGIEDILKNGNEAILRNFQKGKKTARMWKGTLEDAEHMCSLLNRDKTVMEKATHGEQSQSQRAYYSNVARKPAARRAAGKAMSAFKTCTCGAKYKGEKHCDV